MFPNPVLGGFQTVHVFALSQNSREQKCGLSDVSGGQVENDMSTRPPA